MEKKNIDICLEEIIMDGQTLVNNDKDPCWDYECNSPIFPEIIYTFKHRINLKFYGYFDHGYCKITTHINEYIIGVEHGNFWKCTNCVADDDNYYFNDGKLYFCDIDDSGYSFLCIFRTHFKFYFKINNKEALDDANTDVDNNYYSFTEQSNFYITICNLENEINLINFNTTDNFYITNKRDRTTTYEDKGFKIIFLNSFSGQFIGLDVYKNDLELNDGTIFGVSKNQGLRYKLSDEEKMKHGVYLQVKIIAHTSINRNPRPVSQEKIFNFYICLNGFDFYYNDTSLKCLNDGYFYDSIKEKYFSCYEICSKNSDIYKSPNNIDINIYNIEKNIEMKMLII